MKRVLIYVLCVAFVALGCQGQLRLVAEVKQNINALSTSVENFKNAQNKLKPALTNNESKDRAETWHVAGQVQYGIYDKLMANRAIGKKADMALMAQSLLTGYNYFTTALRLDTILIVDKNGQPKVDKKTGQPKVKTKFSDDILSRLSSHLDAYNQMGSQMYNSKQWQTAIDLWEIYCSLGDRLGGVTSDSRARTRFHQGVAFWQAGDNRRAADMFATARGLGYVEKDAYDYALVCLSSVGDEAGVVGVASDAFKRFGTADPQYIRILINNDINQNNFARADSLLDLAVAADTADAELYNLKGLVVEHQHSLEEALPWFEHCIRLEPDNVQGNYNVGRYYYNRASLESEKHSGARARRLAKLVNPIYKQALPYLEKAYRLDPDNVDARNALKNIYFKLGDGKKLEALEKNG